MSGPHRAAPRVATREGGALRISLWLGPHTSFAELCEAARHAEATGWDGLWLADHFLPARGEMQRPTLECWTALAALAVRVPRIGLGSLVCGNTYRHPFVLAKMAATVDHLSGGRLVLGLGAAWQENEHRAFGIRFPPLRERMERLEEACALIRRLFEDARITFSGRHYILRDARLEPKPLQRPLPLLVGGGGARTRRIAARHADAWNAWGTPAALRDHNAALDRACQVIGRAPTTLRRTAVALLRLTEDPDDALRFEREATLPCVAGDAAALRAALVAYADTGVDEMIVPDFNLGRGAERLAALDALVTRVVTPFREARP